MKKYNTTESGELHVMSKQIPRIRKNICEKIVTDNGIRTVDYDKVAETSHLDVKELVHYKSELSKSHQNRPDKEELRGIFSKAING